jgi:exosome complex RNA-binding protein Rrp42 (RNase PH superfamily)
MSEGNVEILKEVQGLEYYKPFFDKEIYEDGRKVSEERPYLIKVGLNKHAAGSSFVQCQGSVVSCHVNAKAGYYDPKQCVRFKLERANCIPKREFDFVRAVLNDFSRQHVFVNPNSLVFDTEYQIQLVVTLTLSTCDGFLLGAVLTAINSALTNTQVPTMSADLLDDDDEMEDDASCKRLMRRRSKFRADTSKMVKVTVECEPHYSGFLIHDAESQNPMFLCDPNEQLINLIRRRVDIVIGKGEMIYFWQNATFENLTKEFRQKCINLAKDRRNQMAGVLEQVRQEGSADSESMA